MSRVRAIATGAAVAACLVVAGQIGGASDRQMGDGKTIRTATTCAEAAAEMAALADTVKQAVVRFVCEFRYEVRH